MVSIARPIPFIKSQPTASSVGQVKESSGRRSRIEHWRRDGEGETSADSPQRSQVASVVVAIYK